MLHRLIAGKRQPEGGLASRFIPYSTLVAIVCVLLFGSSAARATVTANPNVCNTGNNPGTNAACWSGGSVGVGVLQRPDGEALSPFFQVIAGGVQLYVYSAQVRAVNFDDADPNISPSKLTGDTYSANAINNGDYSKNLGTASFAQFQLQSSGNTVFVNFMPGYPTGGTITSTSQIKIISRSPNTFPITLWTGSPNPAGSFSFPIHELLDANGNSIPQQLTIEIDGDWLNSLHIFINPRPVGNGGDNFPSGMVEISPGNVTPSLFTSSAEQYHFAPGIYNVSHPLNFPTGAELYLDDGAILKYTVSNTANGAMISLSDQGTTGNDIIKGWGILDGQASESYYLNGVGSACPIAYQSKAPMCLPQGQNTPVKACGGGTNALYMHGFLQSGTRVALADGITLRNACTYTFDYDGMSGSSTAYGTINNVKIFGFSGANSPNENNSDALDLVNSRYVNVTNSFFRSADDLVTVKQTIGNWTTPGTWPATNINVVGNTFWNEFAHAMVVGGEMWNATNPNSPSQPELAADDILFDSNLIIHDKGKGSLMGIANSYNGFIENITFSNIDVLEDTALYGIGFGPTDATQPPGTLGGSTVCNVRAAAQSAQRVIQANGPPGEPFVGPVPNIQMQIDLLKTSTYGQSGATYGMTILNSPQFSKVQVNYDFVHNTGTLVNSYVTGNDFWYAEGDGVGKPVTTPATQPNLITSVPLPDNVVEESLQIRADGVPGGIWSFFDTSTPAMSAPYFPLTVFSTEMLQPTFPTLTCNASPLLQVATNSY